MNQSQIGENALPGAMASVDWPSPAVLPPLNSGNIHVWSCALDVTSRHILDLFRLLSVNELVQAGRIHSQRDRIRYLIGHVSLRMILSRYTDIPLAELRFRLSRYGKPEIDVRQNDIRFNMSHSDGVALYAVARGREVGVDVERVRPIHSREKIAERSFSPRDRAFIGSLSPDLQQGAFFQAWARREAYLKSRGRGIFMDFQQTDGSMNESEERCSRGWKTVDLCTGRKFSGALSAEGDDWDADCWRWS